MNKGMKILAICGSAHRGNTHAALNIIKDNYPDIDFKILMLNEMNLQMCRGCYGCIAKGPQVCPLKDDRDMIVNEMLEADGVIFASPVYVNSASALMKNFLERTGYEGHRPRFYDKYAMVMATCGMFGAKETNEFMKGLFSSYGFNFISSLELQMGANTEEDKKRNYEKTIQAFNQLIDGIKKGKKNPPDMGQMVRFYIFKMVSAAVPEHFEADYQYYKDKSIIPSEGKISSFKKCISQTNSKESNGRFDR